jgi:hypothetical protein
LFEFIALFRARPRPKILHVRCGEALTPCQNYKLSDRIQAASRTNQKTSATSVGVFVCINYVSLPGAFFATKQSNVKHEYEIASQSALTTTPRIR